MPITGESRSSPSECFRDSCLTCVALLAILRSVGAGGVSLGSAYQIKRYVRNPIRRTRAALQVRSFRRSEPELWAVINDVRQQNLTYLAPEYLVELSEAVCGADRRLLPGVVLEAGTALGGSAIVMGRSKSKERPLWVFDAFGMMPPPTPKDGADVHRRYEEIVTGKSRGIGGDQYYGYRNGLLGDVIESFRAFGLDPDDDDVTFVEGYYEQTMPGSIEFPVAVAHLDCDWYDSVMTCLRTIEPHLVIGGRFLIDDYYNWSGCTDAVNEFFAGKEDYRWEHKSRLHLVKLGD